MTAEVKKRRFAEGVQVTAPQDLSAGSGGGAGEKSYIGNPSESTNWLESTDGEMDVSTTTTAAELPREFTTESGIKIEASNPSTSEYVYYRFSLDDVDMNRKLKIAFAQKSISGYTDDDFSIEIHYNDASDYSGSYTELPINNPEIKEGDRSAVYTFDTDSTGIYYELRIVSAVATSPGIVISDVILGPGTVVTSAVVSPPESYVPGSQGFGTLASTNISWRRVGEYMTIEGEFTVGTPTATEARIDLPPGYTISHPSSDTQYVGGLTRNSATDDTYLVLAVDGDSHVKIGRQEGGGTNAPLSPINGNEISAAGTRWSMFGTFKISEWSGSGTNSQINDQVSSQNARFKASSDAGNAIATNATIDFEDISYNEGGGTESGGVYTVPSSGKYLVKAQLRPNATTASGIGLKIQKNGVNFAEAITDTTAVNSTALISAVVDCVKGDDLEIENGTQTYTTSTDGGQNFFEITRIADYTAGQAVGFGQATSTEFGLVKDDLEANDALGGSFTTGDIYLKKDQNDWVTAHITASTFSSSSFVTSAVGVVPAAFRPSETVYNTSRATTSGPDTIIFTWIISSAGTVQVFRSDGTGSGNAGTSSVGSNMGWKIT